MTILAGLARHDDAARCLRLATALEDETGIRLRPDAIARLLLRQ